jgi:hypothetical protein
LVGCLVCSFVGNFVGRWVGLFVGDFIGEIVVPLFGAPLVFKMGPIHVACPITRCNDSFIGVFAVSFTPILVDILSLAIPFFAMKEPS